MKDTIKPRQRQGHAARALALIAGCIATACALAILLEDPLLNGADWKLKHWLTPGLLALTIICGKLSYSALRKGVITSAAGFFIVFAIGTGLIIVNSVGNQVEQREAKTAGIVAHNGQIERVETALAKARERVEFIEGQIDAQVTGIMGRNGKWKVKPGCGPTCKGWRDTSLPKAEAEVARLAAELNGLGVKRESDPKAAHWGRVAEAFGGDRASIEHALVLIEPVMWALAYELAAIFAFGFAFYSPARRLPVQIEPRRQPEATVAIVHSGDDDDDPPGARRPTRKGEARGEVIGFSQPVAQFDLAERWNVTGAMVSMWLDEWEREGIVKRSRAGRSKYVIANVARRAVA